MFPENLSRRILAEQTKKPEPQCEYKFTNVYLHIDARMHRFARPVAYVHTQELIMLSQANAYCIRQEKHV